MLYARRRSPWKACGAETVRNLYYQGVLTAATAVVSAAGVLVLARVLPPSEYGLAMFAFIVVQTAEMCADFGIMAAMLSRRHELHATVEAAATLRLVLGPAASGALAFLALALRGPASTARLPLPSTTRRLAARIWSACSTFPAPR